jgi:hypothetical protein
MTMRSKKGVSGWVFALLATLVASVLILFGQDLAGSKSKGVKFPERTLIVETVETPVSKPKIVSEPIASEHDSDRDLIVRSELSTFRSPSPSALAMIEPTSSVRITAPLARDFTNPFESTSASALLAAKATQNPNTTVASLPVSATISSSPQDSASGASRSDPLFQRRQVPAAMVSNRNWPLASSLLTQSSSLTEASKTNRFDGLDDWSSQVSQLFESLSQVPIQSDRSSELLGKARELAAQGFAWAEANLETATSQAFIVSQVAHGIQRRAIVWDRVYQCIGSEITGSDSEKYVSVRRSELDYGKLAKDLEVVRGALEATSDSSNWSDFLMLDQIEKLANGSLESQEQQIQVAQEFLGRLTFSRVSEDQKKVLASREIQTLAEDVRPLTVIPVDYRKLLLDIESIEESSVHRSCVDVAEAIQSLRFADSQTQYAIANALNQQYRNANVRLSVSEEFVNRLMPKDQVSTRPVQQRILGADTQGASKIQTNLQVDFLPDTSGWKVALNLDGNIQSNTRSSRSGATFYNSSNAKVQSVREIRIDPASLSINGQPANVQSQESLRKFSTNWDQMPIIGDMVRYVAKQEFNEKKTIAKRISQKLIAKQTDDEFNKQLQTNIDRAQEQFDKRLIGPLHSLDLQPMILDMQSTDSRLVARYRVAGVNQIAAYTPRPLAPSESLLSVQLHQSAINNLIAQAIPTDRDWTIRQLADKIAQILQQPPFALPEDTPEDVSIRFMDVHPMTIEFAEGRMWLTLRIASLEQPGRIQLKNFTVRTSYIPTVEGLRASLERDPLISVDGHRLGSKDRFPIRAIFTKVFSGNSAIPMVAESLISNPLAQGMQVSQLQMEQGWLAIAVSDSKEKVQPSLPPIVDPIAAGATKKVR